MAKLSSEYQQLSLRRDLAAYGLVSTAMLAMSYLNLGEIAKAQDALQGAVLDYQLADELLSRYPKKENADGNRTATA